MAKIMNVDYEAIPGHAATMREQGNSLNSELTTAYQSIADMHKSWYGKRYNSLVQEFNKIIPQINELLDLVVGDFPFALETVANNYSQADRGSRVTAARRTDPKKIANIATSNDVGMKFLTSDVEATKSKVSKNFKNAKSKMDEIEQTYAKIKWESEASQAFKTKFTKLKNSIVQSIENINTQFTKLMQQTLEDIQATETNNTVK